MHVPFMQTDASSRQGGYSVRTQGLRFVNTTQVIKWTVPYNQIWLDLDGSLSGFVNGTVIPYTPFNNFGPTTSGCARAGTMCVGVSRLACKWAPVDQWGVGHRV